MNNQLASSGELSTRLERFCAFYKVDDPQVAMKTACSRLLRSCRQHHLPIALKPLCDALNVRVIRRTTIGTGTLRCSGGSLEIWLNPDLRNWRRDRFTIAHELAHILILATHNGQDDLSYNSSADFDQVEKLCNLGAAELLMPPTQLLDCATRFGISSTGLRDLYDQSLVSYEALLFRIAEIIPSSAMILWRKYARSKHEEHRLRVITSYQRYDSNAHAPWLPKGSTSRHLTPDIVTEAMRSDKPIATRQLSINLNGDSGHCVAVACRMPTVRSLVSTMPLFHGRRVLDDQRPNIDVVLLAVPAVMDARPSFWNVIAPMETVDEDSRRF